MPEKRVFVIAHARAGPHDAAPKQNNSFLSNAIAATIVVASFLSAYILYSNHFPPPIFFYREHKIY